MTLEVALELLIQLAGQVEKVGALMRAAALEGRDISDEELAGLASGDNDARQALKVAIDRARNTVALRAQVHATPPVDPGTVSEPAPVADPTPPTE